MQIYIFVFLLSYKIVAYYKHCLAPWFNHHMMVVCRDRPHSFLSLYSYSVVWIYYRVFHQFPINGHSSCLQPFAVKSSLAKMMYRIGLFVFLPMYLWESVVCWVKRCRNSARYCWIPFVGILSFCILSKMFERACFLPHTTFLNMLSSFWTFTSVNEKYSFNLYFS